MQSIDDFSKFNTMLLSLKENKSPTKFQISVFLNRENSSEVFFIVIRRVHSLNSCKNLYIQG